MLRTMNEAETRAEHIDPALKAAGWGVVERSRIRWEYPTTLGRIEGHGKRGEPKKTISIFIAPKGKLLIDKISPDDRKNAYKDFPPLRA